jgi:cysteine-rich repeat protein
MLGAARRLLTELGHPRSEAQPVIHEPAATSARPPSTRSIRHAAALLLCLALLVGATAAEAGRRRGPVCGDGRVEGTEQCDDGNRTPLDGCSAACEMEEPTHCLPTTEAEMRGALAGSDTFHWLETYAADTLGFSTPLHSPLACSEGHGTTTYMAVLEHPDAQVEDAVLMSRTDLPGELATMLLHPIGSREYLVYTSLFAIHLELLGNGQLKTLTILDLDGQVLSGSTSPATAEEGPFVDCDQAWAEVQSCRSAEFAERGAELAAAAVVAGRCLAEATAECAGSFCLSCVAVLVDLYRIGGVTDCSSLDEFTCSTSAECNVGVCRLLLGGSQRTYCDRIDPPTSLCTGDCTECVDGECLGFEIVDITPQPYETPTCLSCCSIDEVPGAPSLRITTCGNPRFPVAAYSTHVDCPPDWECFDGANGFWTPENPIVWPEWSRCYSCGYSPALPVSWDYDIRLVDSRGIEATARVGMTCVAPPSLMALPPAPEALSGRENSGILGGGVCRE